MLRRRDQTVRSLRVEHYSSAVNTCLKNKKARLRDNTKAMLGLFDSDDMPEGITENTIHVLNDRTTGGADRQIHFPTAEEAYRLFAEIDATESDLAEIEKRLEDC